MSLSESSNGIILRGIGMDCVGNLLIDSRLRPAIVNGRRFGSCVDWTYLFKPNTNNPRRYWSDQKRALLKTNPQLYERIVQLKLPAADGKLYLTDLAPLPTLIFIGIRMRTPLGYEFAERVANVVGNMTEVAINYRISQIMAGSEWAADATRLMIGEDDDPPKRESAWEEMGYRSPKHDYYDTDDHDNKPNWKQEL